MNKFLKIRWFAWVIVIICVGMIFVFGKTIQSELAPLEDKGSIRITMTGAEGTSYEDMKGELKPDSGRDGSPEENEANARAAVTMRKWGKLHPELFGKQPVE